MCKTSRERLAAASHVKLIGTSRSTKLKDDTTQSAIISRVPALFYLVVSCVFPLFFSSCLSIPPEVPIPTYAESFSVVSCVFPRYFFFSSRLSFSPEVAIPTPTRSRFLPRVARRGALRREGETRGFSNV